MAKQTIEQVSLEALRPWARNARTHSKKQIRQIADSIRSFGFTNAVLIDAQNTILGRPRTSRGRKAPRMARGPLRSA